MTPTRAPDFPELRKVFSGYLHEDFLEEHGTATQAIAAFEADADAHERQRFRAEVKRFLEATAPLGFVEVRALLSRLGARWSPPTREAMIAALAGDALGRERDRL